MDKADLIRRATEVFAELVPLRDDVAWSEYVRAFAVALEWYKQHEARETPISPTE